MCLGHGGIRMTSIVFPECGGSWLIGHSFFLPVQRQVVHVPSRREDWIYCLEDLLLRAAAESFQCERFVVSHCRLMKQFLGHPSVLPCSACPSCELDLEILPQGESHTRRKYACERDRCCGRMVANQRAMLSMPYSTLPVND